MKQETNNEMDLLLRRLGRRPEITVSDANGDVDHLDADELNAYAENVLPAAARARYTAHLAECERCRELVVQLSSAAGLVPVPETTTVTEPSALRKFLASLFSPMVLRYAVPALGLIVVAALGLFVFRQQEKDANSIAQKAQAPAPSSNTTAAPEQVDQAKGFSNQPKESTAKPAKSSGSPEEQSAAVAAAAAPSVTGDTSQEALAKKTDQPATAEEPASTPASGERQQAEARKEAPQSRVAQASPDNSAKVAALDKAEDRKAPEVKPASASPSSRAGAFQVGEVHGIATARAKRQRDDAAGRDKDKEKDEAEAETRNVAGRRFRKQGGVWVDTAYNFSRNATTLTRNSEQYRALIADEPEIKTIADQLDGEILVVWKGRPYRIK